VGAACGILNFGANLGGFFRADPHALKALKRELHGQKAVLVRDGLPAHKSKEMKAYLEQQRNWLRVERLPGLPTNCETT
jgi:hypothetical protein